MSRSNTNYYNLCTSWGEIAEDGFCDFHRGGWKAGHKCISPREWMTRRGIVKRKSRFPEGLTWKCWCSGPPMSVKKAWRRQVRAKYRAAVARRPSDPELPDCGKWLAGMYGWWS